MTITSQLSSLNINPLELIASLPGHVYWVNREGVILGCNEQLVQSLGLKSTEDLIGKSIFDLYSKEEADILLQNNLKVINSGKPLFIEEPASYRKKNEVYLSYKVPLRNKKGDILGVLGISFDITGRVH